MRKRGGMIAVLMATTWVVDAQLIEIKPDTLDFGVVNELTTDSLLVWVYNLAGEPIQFSDWHAREWYGDAGVQVTIPQLKTNIPANDSLQIWVRFHPRHNLDYSGGLVLAGKGPAGSTVVHVKAQGRYSNSYYSPTENLSEEALKTALNTLLAQNYSGLSYNSARDVMYATLDNVGGDVTCVYTGRTATFNDRPGANNNNFNCEHTFPQGFFNQASPMRNDIHHLFPTDGTANSVRSNHPFNDVSNPTWQQGGSKYGGGQFEPRDAHKGAAARAMLYFVIRYQDYAGFFAPQEQKLKNWNLTFLPNAFETGRNNGIFAIQNNRNPFVDYPQLADRINHFVSHSTANPVFELTVANDTVFLPYQPGASPDFKTYQTVFLNTGNQPVYVQPQAFSTGSVFYINGSDATTTLFPGEYKVIELGYDYGQSVLPGTSLKIMTNLPQGELEIPVMSQNFIGIEEEALKQNFASPIPADEHLNIEGDFHNYSIADLNGRIHSEGQIFDGSIHVSTLPDGIYILRLQGRHEVQVLRIAVKH